jgi:hypothetical protein
MAPEEIDPGGSADMRMDWASGLSGTTGPYATVATDASRNEEDSARENQLRWEGHARRLTELGAPDDVVKALGDTVTAPTHRGGRHGRLTVATSDGVVLDLVLPGPPVRESSLWGPVPQLLPAARVLRDHLTYVLAEVDSAGGEIHVVTPWGEVTQDVQGDHDELHAVPGGGWSHRRYRSRVEDSIARNADEVARVLADVVRDTRPELVLLAGEPKSVSELLDGAPGEIRSRAVRLQRGSRAAKDGEGALDAEIAAVVAERLRQRRAEVLDRFAGGEARQDSAVQSLPDVVGALQRGQVDELLLVDDPSSDLTLWATGQPGQLALDRADLAAMGVADDAREVRADAAISWALAGTGAGITIFDAAPEDPALEGDPDPASRPPRLRDGIGAVLRWDDRSTPHDAAPSMPGHGEPAGAPPEW